jgi:hypothetical protein
MLAHTSSPERNVVGCMKRVGLKIGNMGRLSNIYVPLSGIGNEASRILVVVFSLPRKLLNPIHLMPSVTALLRSLRLEA